MMDEIVLLELKSRIATTTAPEAPNFGKDILNTHGVGALFYINITDVTGGGSLTGFEVQTAIGDSVNYKTIYTFTQAMSTTGIRAFLLYPNDSMATGGFTQAPTVGILPRRFKVKVNHTDASAITYYMGMQTLIS